MDKLNLDRKSLKKFGITMGVAFLVISLLILIKHRHSALPTAIISLAFFVSAFIIPPILKPVYILWMKLAFVLSWVNTRLILLIVFYLILTPISLAMKLFGKDPLHREIERDKESYWEQKPKKEFNAFDYEKQF